MTGLAVQYGRWDPIGARCCFLMVAAPRRAMTAR